MHVEASTQQQASSSPFAGITPERVKFWKDCLELALLVLALPWILAHFLRSPDKAVERGPSFG